MPYAFEARSAEENLTRFRDAVRNISQNTGKTEAEVLASIRDEIEHGEERRVRAIAEILQQQGIDPTEYLAKNLPK